MAHSEGLCLNIEQLAVALVESELLFLNSEGVFELEVSGDPGS